MTQNKTPAVTLKSLGTHAQVLETGTSAQSFLGEIIGNSILTFNLVGMEPTLVGQDISALASDATDIELPNFEDEPFDDSYWSANEAATHFGVSKSTITRKIKAGELIGFKLFKNALYVPKEQMDGKNLIKGISDVLKMFESDHYDAWQFLTADVFYGEPLPRPLDRLRNAKANSLQDVLSEIKVAASGFEFGSHI